MSESYAGCYSNLNLKNFIAKIHAEAGRAELIIFEILEMRATLPQRLVILTIKVIILLVLRLLKYECISCSK